MIRRVLVRFAVAFVLASSVPMAHHSAQGSDVAMKAPGPKVRAPASAQELETSSPTIACLGAIRFYQRVISPIGGNRCGFWPSCSAYGYQAIKEQGPVLGIIMIGDRQIRCNIWKESGPDYTRLPNGKLYDPPTHNFLLEKGTR